MKAIKLILIGILLVGLLFGFTGNVYAALISINVVPATATMAVGDHKQFLAVGDDGQGGTVVLADPQWSVSGGATLIPIADTCIVRADQTGCYTLACRERGTTIEGNSQIEITSNLASIEFDPSTAALKIGDNKQFIATGKDQYGNTVTLASPQWSTTGGGTLSQSGSTCTYTATTTGSYTITCQEGGTGIKGTATITVTASSQLTSIELTPSTASLKIGENEQFTATGKDQHGNTVTLTNPQWSTTGGGTLSPSGSTCTYTATTTGSYTITCQEGGTSIKGTATIHTTGTPVETATGTGTAYFATDAGTLENLAAVDESTLPAAGKPALVFPHGFFSFSITGLTPCTHQKVVVTITLPSAVPVGTEYWKYHASEGGWIQIPMSSDDGDNVITITLEDGGLGDDDGECNGVIVDSGGPGVGVFDTGSPANPYPSISGTHRGTITLNQTITVSRLYTYPCAGTGGHSEYARIWNTTLNVTARWDGYRGEWHNISFDKTFTLAAHETYNYTIKTGSYPQIIHEQTFTNEYGTITCTEFTDTNGRVYYDWIPAIKLFH